MNGRRIFFWSVPVLARLLVSVPAEASTGIRWAQIVEGSQPRPPGASKDLIRVWPLCPTDRNGCSASRPPAWVQLGISVDAYTARVRDPHDSLDRLIAGAKEDVAPLAEELARYFAASGLNDKQKVAFVQGLVQGIRYAKDEATGWTEYPKYPLEMIVDQQGDCDDAAIATAALLDALGFDAWFVRWRGPTIGHLSTAVPHEGPLGEVRPPAGSKLIPVPGKDFRLLHVDGVGAETGCESGCSALGWNQWEDPPHNLTVSGLGRFADPDLSTKIPISAWNNGGLERPQRKVIDRRGRSAEEIVAEVPRDILEPEVVTRRLRRIGLTESEALSLMRRRRTGDELVFWVLTAITLAILAGLLAAGFARRRYLLLAAQRLQEDRQKRRF